MDSLDRIITRVDVGRGLVSFLPESHDDEGGHQHHHDDNTQKRVK
jgi:hypothetical protein